MYLVGNGLARSSARRCRLLKYRFVAQPVARGDAVGSRRAGTTVISLATPDDPIVAAFPRPAQVIAKRYADGAVCFVARVDGRFAGFLWLNCNGYDEDEVRCRFDPLPRAGTAWDFDVHVEPPYRLGRTFVRLWDAANAYLREREVTWTMSRISAFNPESLRAHARMGSRELGSAVFLCLGTLQLALFTLPPFAHVSWRERSRPSLKLEAPLQGDR